MKNTFKVGDIVRIHPDAFIASLPFTKMLFVIKYIKPKNIAEESYTVVNVNAEDSKQYKLFANEIEKLS
jgi:hypothetical protein